MNVTKCDWCQAETQNTADWFTLKRPWPQNDPERGFPIMGREELDFCSSECAVLFLKDQEA